MDENIKRPLVIDVTVIIGLVTLIGYLMTYYYLSGFKAYYNIPEPFIEININSIVLAFSRNIFTLLFFLFLIMILPDLVLKFRNYLFLLTIASVSFVLLAISKFNYKVFIITGAYIVIYLIASILIKIKKTKKIGLEKKLISTLKGNNRINNRNFTLMVSALALFICFSPFFQLAGEHDAKNQKQYLIIQNPSLKVVLDSYKDYLIVAPIDINKKTISPEFQFLKQKEDTDKVLSFQLVETGKLKVDKPSKSVTQNVYKKP